jgi:hypothetical protein
MRFKNRWDTPASLEFVFVSLHLLYLPLSLSFTIYYLRLYWPRLSRELFFLFGFPLLSEFLWSVSLFHLVIFYVSLNGAGRRFTPFFFSYGFILPFYSIPYPCFLLLCACFVFLDTWGMRCVTRFSFTSWGLFHFSPSSLLSTRYEEILMSELSHKTMAKYSNNLLGALLCKKNSI